MKKNKQYIIVLLVAITLFSCKKNSVNSNSNTLNYQYDYFPTTIGHWVIYKVDSITYDDFYNPILIDTSRYYVKEQISELFNDDEGRETYIVNRYRSEVYNGEYLLFDRHVINLLSSRAEKVEDNLRFIKLVFPSFNNQKWSGNNYINSTSTDLEFYANWEYQYMELYSTKIIGEYVFDSVMTVLQRDDENLLEKNYFEEKYVRDIGLVYKKKHSVGKQNIGEEWSEGYELTFTIVDYKK